MTIKKYTQSQNILRIPVAVDLVVLTVRDNALCVLLVKRGISPFKGKWALPGGFVCAGESLESAAERELTEETGIAAAHVGYMEQLGTFGAPNRDPREHVIAVAYLAFVPDLPEPKAGGDAHFAAILPVSELFGGAEKLAFDHETILQVGVERTRAKLEYTPLAAAFCGDEFTINALRRVYEAVWGCTLDAPNFHRKVTKTAGFVVATDTHTSGESGRPAQLYTQGDALTLYPPMLRGG